MWEDNIQNIREEIHDSELDPTGEPDSSVGIATRYGLDRRGSIPFNGNRFFFPSQRPDRL
jgi:hypothetical protein